MVRPECRGLEDFLSLGFLTKKRPNQLNEHKQAYDPSTQHDKRKNTHDQPSFEKSRRPWNMACDHVHTHDHKRCTKSRCIFINISQLRNSVIVLAVASEQYLYVAPVRLPHMCYQHVCLLCCTSLPTAYVLSACLLIMLQ